MKNLVAAVAIVFAVHAWAGSGSFVDCSSLTYCRAPTGTIRAYEVPTIIFDTTDATPYNISAKVWAGSGCTGEVDHTCAGSGYIGDPGRYFLVSDTERPEGWGYSIQWTVAGCPEQPCINGTIGTAPDVCALEQ